MALGAGLLVLILLVLGFRGCLNARTERAFKDYGRDMAALLKESDGQSDTVFGLLTDPGDAGAVDIENQLNAQRNQAAELLDRVRGTDHPGELDEAHRFLIETFEFRRDGLAALRDDIPRALGTQERREGSDRVAADMQNFLASDVIYLRRVVPRMQAAIEEQDLSTAEVPIPRSEFLPDIDWLQPGVVADRISRISGGRAGGAASPGLHGNGIGTVSLGGQALVPGGSASVNLSDNLTFQVQVANQGENTETDVKAQITIGRGGDKITLAKTLNEIAAGETKTVELPLRDRPPTGQQLPVTVAIEPVPGEKKTDNNKGTFSVIFTR
jgi:CARDB protein